MRGEKEVTERRDGRRECGERKGGHEVRGEREGRNEARKQRREEGTKGERKGGSIPSSSHTGRRGKATLQTHHSPG